MEATRSIIESHITCIQSIAENQNILTDIERAARVIADTFNAGGSVLFCGNGGSAADASHLAAELSGKFQMDRPALPAFTIHDNPAALTAVSNDFGYERGFSRLVEAFGSRGDLLFALSTSGQSANVINAMQSARHIGLTNLCITGKADNEMMQFSEISIRIPSVDTARIQEATMLIGHIICHRVEEHLFG